MAVAAQLSVEEYLRLTDKPHHEYRDGELRQKSMPTWLHSLLQMELARLLMAKGLHAAVELHVRVTPTRYMVPDVVAARTMEMPYPTEPVLLCCEILSPEDRLAATFMKCEEYHDWGVPYCWVIDPEKRKAWEYHKGQEPNRVSATLVAEDIQVDLSELFAVLPGA